MRTLKSIMVLGLALSTFTATEAAKLTFKVTNPNEKVKVRLTFSQSGEQKEVAIDAAGNGNIEITGFTPQYVTMQYTRGRRTLYLDPNQDLTLSFDSDNMWRNTTFEGAGTAINTYLHVCSQLPSIGSRKSSGRFHCTGKNTSAILYVLLFLQIRFVSSSFWKG